MRRSWKAGRNWFTAHVVKSTNKPGAPEVGFVVDAGPGIGYGHVVRSHRLARALGDDSRITFFPLSTPCRGFLEAHGWNMGSAEGPFPPLVVTDLARPDAVLGAIEDQGCRHIAIRDLGLNQGPSDVLIDPSIANLLAYTDMAERDIFLGPDYMIVAPSPEERRPEDASVLVSLGGGASSEFTRPLAEALVAAGLRVFATKGFDAGNVSPSDGPVRWVETDAEIHDARSRCAVAVTTAGVSLYEMLASGVPTVAMGVDDVQLRTAEAFAERGAVENAGLLPGIDPRDLASRTIEMIRNHPLRERLGETGPKLVDGKGLARVSEIVRRELCLTA